MNSKQLNELLAGENHSTAIAELKNGRNATEPNAAEYIAQLDPQGHDVNDPVKRRDKKVKVDLSDFDINDEEKKNIKTVTNGDGETENFRIEPVARVALAIQKLIVKRAVAFTFGNPVILNAEPEEGTKEADVLKAVKRVLFDNKSRTLNRKVARGMYSSKESAELWYPVEKPTKNYGFDSTHKLRVAIFSPLFGDRLYPYFDETGDMVAFSREYVVKDSAGVKHTYFETYTDTEIRKWTLTSNQWQLLDGYPKKNQIGKIPVIYGRQPAVEWEDVQNLIDRLEKLLSNFADTNDYHASPKIFTTGTILGWAKKGESGAVIEGEEGATAQYLSWAQAPESVKLEIETLLRMIYTIWKIQCKLPPKTKRFCPLKTFNNAPLKSLDRWGYYYFSLFPSVCSHFTDTFSCQLNPVRRMYNTIHNGICYCRVSDCIIPIVRWQLRGDDDGLAPMSVLYYIEQDGSFLGIKVHKEEVIQYEQRAPFDSLEFRFQCAFYFCHLKRTHKFRSIRIICPYALLAGFIPHCCGKEALPGTG